MTRILLLALLLLAVFFGVYGTLRQIDWMKLMNVEQNIDKTEKKLGEMIWNVFSKSERELKDKLIEERLEEILLKLCEANDIDRKNIKLHILDKDEVNAFALPDGYLIVFSGLIKNAENPEELAGVIAHELAHIELDHVMKRLIKEIHLSVLISMTTGSAGGEMAKEIAKKLSSSAFDRSQEKEADLTAVDYMIGANIDPEPYGEFLYRLGGKTGRASQYLLWISTHPDPRERAEYIMNHIKEQDFSTEPVISEENWEEMQDHLDN